MNDYVSNYICETANKYLGKEVLKIMMEEF